MQVSFSWLEPHPHVCMPFCLSLSSMKCTVRFDKLEPGVCRRRSRGSSLQFMQVSISCLDPTFHEQLHSLNFSNACGKATVSFVGPSIRLIPALVFPIGGVYWGCVCDV